MRKREILLSDLMLFRDGSGLKKEKITTHNNKRLKIKMDKISR